MPCPYVSVRKGLSVAPIVVVLIFLFSVPLSTRAQESRCVTTIAKGWNLKSVGSLFCGILKLDSMKPYSDYFPAYLDVYGYTGSEYSHARITKNIFMNGSSASRSFETSLEKYVNSRIKKITDEQYQSSNDYFRDVNKDLMQNNEEKMAGYAARLAREFFTSVWVYNPGRDFTIEYTGRDKQSIASVAIVNLLFGDISDGEYSQLAETVETEVLPGMQPDFERQPAALSFYQKIFSGNIMIDKGWNFLTHSSVLRDTSGSYDFKSGNCTITKAYVFNGESKQWVPAATAPRSLFGSGMIVYNSGTSCTLAIKNAVVSTLKGFLGSSVDENKPPQLPE